MMESPDTFYLNRLQGKTPREILSVIRSLKRKITRLKNIVENPNYNSREWAVEPCERTQIYCCQTYLLRAYEALEEAGGSYTPTAAEKRANNFNNQVPYITKIVFTRGGLFSGYKTFTHTFSENAVTTTQTYSLNPNVAAEKATNKEEFLDLFDSLNIGEWRRSYTTERFGFTVLDGAEWKLEIHYQKGIKPKKYCGINAYPFNFPRAEELFTLTFGQNSL